MVGVGRRKATVCDSSVDKEDMEGGVCELWHHRQKQQRRAKKKANSRPAPESPPGPTRCLLLAVVILFMSFVVFALNLCCKIASFSPLGQGISAGERMPGGHSAPLGWTRCLAQRPSSAEQKWCQQDPSARESESMENPASHPVPAPPQGVQAASPEGCQVLDECRSNSL